MVYYLIVCRSLTYAQRTAAALERAGIGCHMFRAPRAVAGEGCGYCVKIAERNLTRALQVLGRAGLTPKRVFFTQGTGDYREVGL